MFAQSGYSTFTVLKSLVNSIRTKYGASIHDCLNALMMDDADASSAFKGRMVELKFQQMMGLYPHLHYVPVNGGKQYDGLVNNTVRIQIKQQTTYHGCPKQGKDSHVVTLKKSGSSIRSDGKRSQLYGKGDFDALAVGILNKDNEWTFMMCPTKWLKSSSKAGSLAKEQKVPKKPNDKWTDNVDVLLERLKE